MVTDKSKSEKVLESMNILLVGNNPIELSSILNTIKGLPGRIISTETAFDLTSIWQRLIKFKPNYILIDDNIGYHELTRTVGVLSSNPKTREIPITVLKNSNYTESAFTNDIADYLLKQNLTTESLYIALKNSLKFKRTREFLSRAYAKRKRELLKLVR
ncbi:MAG: hypothetical protein KF725_01280 [Cyclobacteriaceae bacterium]|nr:hypothetical protein [Cyclobacteriaceae bacterium]UYN86914.1 MAG: hypothetical protein KIT51_01125 [Cyclobacteriaceae bacterium]